MFFAILFKMDFFRMKFDISIFYSDIIATSSPSKRLNKKIKTFWFKSIADFPDELIVDVHRILYLYSTHDEFVNIY